MPQSRSLSDHCPRPNSRLAAINNGAVTCASASQYDALEQLGNEGWNWDNLLQYFKRFQRWTPPNKEQSDAGARSDASVHGTDGPVSVAFSPGFYKGPQQPAFVAGVKEALGVKQVDDLCSGDANAVAYTQNTIEPTGDQIRSSSATGYLTPVENSRSNLVVLTNWRGVKMNWAEGSSESSRAASVVAQSKADGPQETFAASSEVIVAAGAIRSPLFLEASGIGESSVLERIGVQQKVDLPGVGKNLQEQTMSVLGTPKGDYDFGGNGPSAVIAMPSISQLMKNATEVEAWVRQNMDAWAEQQVQGGGSASKSGLLKQYNVLTDLIFKQNAPVVELFGDSGFPSSGLGIDHWQLLPLSRGYVHSTDASGFSHPDLNPRYFDVPLDMQITVHGLRASRKTLKSNAIQSALKRGEDQPGFSQIPDGPNNGRWDRWEKYVLDGFGSVSHQIGTAAMLPREDGGVVGPDFKVHGTSNVRVVDGSVLPIQLSAHLSASLYAFAEKAAATIKGAA